MGHLLDLLFTSTQEMKLTLGMAMNFEGIPPLSSTCTSYLFFLLHSYGVFRHYFEAATASVGLELSVTGAIGFRTVHQVKF